MPGEAASVCRQDGEREDQRPNPTRRAVAPGYPVDNLLSPESSMCLRGPDTNKTASLDLIAAVSKQTVLSLTGFSPINRNEKTFCD